jgi:uroporphyrin-III C-methyltransferase
MNGKVYLVGAGPGDPELLTMKALRLLRTADVVLHDDLVTPEILKLISPVAHVQNVGKRCGTKTIRQEEINFLMVTLAASGRQLVRLKSGDPLIFGRAGEEIEALRRANIEYEIVPGVTAAFGAAAACGIPLTHREISSSVVITTGHHAASKNDVDVDWNAVAASRGTLVVYMPGSAYSEISSKLIAAGFAADTPCAIISRATTDSERRHLTAVSNLHRAPRLASPTLLIVGDVVRLANADQSEDLSKLAAHQLETLPAVDFFASAQNSSSNEEPFA